MDENYKKRALLKNTIMLYILTFSSYLMSFIVVPYQTRVLGPEKYGMLGVATAIMVYFKLFIDFGFLLSATAEVSNCTEDKNKLSRIFTSVTVNKIVLSSISFFALILLCTIVPQWQDNLLFFILFFLSTVLGSLIPDYLYRGIEKMGAITLRTVLIKLFFTLMVFVLVKDPDDYILIPILNIIGDLVALLGVYCHLFFKLKIRFISCSWWDIRNRMKQSSLFFLSRIATTAYTAANTIVLDLMFAGGMTAYYTSADKLVSTAKNGLSPISDSLYPYMVKNRDFKIVKKVLFVLEPIILLGCTILFIWAKPICIWFFGEQYAHTADALRALLPVVAITLPNYICGFPVLGAMGLSKHANYTVIVGSILHIGNLILLFVTKMMNIVTLGIATSIAEGLILLYRIIVIVRYKKRFNSCNRKGEKNESHQKTF